MSLPSSSQIELDLEDKTNGEQKAACHLMPCRIESKEMDVKARQYFWPTIRELQKGGDQDQGRKIRSEEHKNGNSAQTISEQPILTASFRGRPLQGRRLKLPDGYKGHVVSKPNTRLQSPAARNKVIDKHFDELTYWNWDELPEKSDSVVKAFGWLNVAKAIHEPI